MKAEQLLTEVCSLPTAPFAEDAVISYAKEFVRQRKKLKLTRDSWGNLLVELVGKSKSPRWVFTAHMDHPGFLAEKMIAAKMLKAHFFGWVAAEYLRGEKVTFGDMRGVVMDVQKDKDKFRAKSATIRVDGEVEPNTAGMFDQGLGRVKGGKFYSRAIDDLGGLAACLAMMDELHRRPPKVTVGVLLTRAEEEGFIGAIGAVLKPQLLKKSDRVIAIECSAMQPYAPQGAGTIIRIGDKTSVFNSSLSYHLTQVAANLAKRDKSFKYQRALMPGGTCEASVYDAYGYQAGSICVPLGNYHNMDREKKKIGPEFIDLEDWRNMVKLFVEVARRGEEYEEGLKPFKERVEKRFNEVRRFL